MNYHILTADVERQVALGPVDESIWDFFIDRWDETTAFKDKWKTFEVAPLFGLRNKNDLVDPGDIVDFNLTSIFMFSERARATLGPLLERYGELLPVFGLGRTFYLYHVTTLIDALDETQAVVERFKSGRIMRVTRYALRKDSIGDADVFRMPSDKWKVFVSDRFVASAGNCGLSGFEFSLISE